MSNKTIQKIGIALIERDGHYLVGIRQDGIDLAGKAEFPGGKCNAGESVPDCIIRESLEETGLNVVPAEEFYRSQFSYAHAEVDLHFWICNLEVESESEPDSHFWVKVTELKNHSFPEANGPVLDKLLKRNG